MTRIEQLKEFLKLQQKDSFLQHALALEYIKLNNEEEAKDLFESILENNPAYVGSYYHFAKLLDRIGKTDMAISIYQKGMEVAKNANDLHTFNELQSAYEELLF